MKTIIWKELRENARWAALGWFALLLAELYALGKENDEGLPLLNSAFLLVSPFGCLLIGGALGALQYLPELGRDRWAALVHRPVTRGAIFAGKAWAGVLLYLLVTSLPLLISVIYVNLPHRFAAPFVPRMVLPALSDMVFGLAVYFAAVLLCLHRERWFGSRGMLLLSLIPLTICQLSGTGFFWLPGLAIVLFALAAWGAITASRAWLPRGAFLALVLTGSSVVSMIIATILLNLFSITSSDGNSFAFRNFVITNDGQVLISSQTADSAATLTTVSGEPVTDEHYLGSQRFEHLIQLYPFLFFTDNHPSGFGYYMSRFPRNATNYAMRLRGRYDSPEVWYLLVDGNYVVGYERLSRRFLGTIGAGGFRAPDASPVPFPARLQTNDFYGSGAIAIYWAGSRVYTIDFETHVLSTVLQASADVYAAARFSPNFEEAGLIVAALPSGLKILDEQGTLRLEAPYLHDLWPNGGISVATDLKHVFVQYSSVNLWREGSSDIPDAYLQVLDLKGAPAQEYSLPGQSVPPMRPTLAAQVVTALLPVAPVGLTAALSKYMIQSYSFPGAIVQASLRVNVATLWSAAVAALACAILALGLAHRARLASGQTWLWVVVALLFGLPGLLAFLAAADWPVRVRCAHCGQRRAVKEESCGSCHEGWPRASATGTEILDGAAS